MESSQFTDSQTRYESLEPLEVQGATCDTFRVKLFGKLHFLKRLKQEYANDIRYQEAFCKEFETGYRLEHPHLVRYILYSDNGILMEYVDGETLTQRLARQPDYFNNRKNTDKFIRQLLDVVGYLHSHQVLHLDLKPDNILLTRINDDVKLIDLGCCYTDTFTDTTGHTNRYAAPEQLSGEEPDARTDIYAIGKIIELLPNHHIYNKIIARCTASDKADRYQSVAEILSELSRAKISKRLLWFGALSLFILSLIITASFLWWNSDTAVVQTNHNIVNHDSIHTNQTDIVQEPLSSESTPPPVTRLKTSVDRTDKPEPSPSTAKSAKTSIEQLQEDIKVVVLPKFNATMGALPDSVIPGTMEWANAGWEFEPMLTQALKDLIISHQDIPMETVTKEFNDYVQSLITLKVNRALNVKQQP